MSINHLTAALLADAKDEASSIIGSAEEEKKKRLALEKKNVVSLLKKAEEEANSFVLAQTRERIAWAKLEAKKIEGEAKETVVRNMMTELYKKLQKFRKASAYPKFLNQRVSEALDELSVPNPVVHVCTGDKKLLKGIKAKIVEDFSGMGGAIIESQDGAVQVDCSLETLFEEKKEFLRKRLYENMFR